MADVGHWITLEDGRHVFISESAGSVPRRLRTTDGDTRFSKAHLERHLIQHHESVEGKGTVSAADQQKLQKAAGSGDPFTFHKKLPTEIKDFMQGRPELRRMLKVTDKAGDAGGADAFGELGDKYLDIAESKAGSPLRAAKETAHASNDPEVKLLASIHDNLPEGRFSGNTINAKGLRVGDEFTIGGSKFRVAEDSQGMRVLEGGKDYPETPVDALDKLPVDKGSFKHGKRQREVIPFSGDAVVLSLASDSAKPALVMGQGLPKEINGQPAHYFRKEVARAGHYVHRSQRTDDGKPLEFDITRERIDRWLSSFQRLNKAGVKPFLPNRHVDDKGEYVRSVNDARANNGYAVNLERDGDSLFATLQLIGDDAARIAAANDVSIFVEPDTIDAAGNQYEECIKHIALTPDPIIPHLGPFTRIAASADQPPRDVPVYRLAANEQTRSPDMDKQTIASLRAKFGWGQDIPDEQIPAKAAETALALSGEKTTLAKQVTDLTTERDQLKQAVTAKEQQVLSLSGDGPGTNDPIALGLITRAFKTDRERVIESGVISEAGMKALDELFFVEGKPTHAALALSGGSVDPRYSRLCDILRKNPGIKTNNGVPRDVKPAEQMALSGDPQAEKPNEAEVAEMRRRYNLPAPAAK